MSTQHKHESTIGLRGVGPGGVALLLTWVLLANVAADAAPEAGSSTSEARLSISRHHVTGGREGSGEVSTSEDEYDAIVTGGNQSGTSSKPRSVEAQNTRFDFWIYDADVQLFNDDDRDGYYHGIDVLFDADTIYAAADVYAVLYLSYEGGPWNEYAVTEDFTIFGASSSDEYVVVTELMSGYPTGSYDLLIELYDPFDGAFLAEFGPADSSGLSFLPLEDFDRDAPVGEVPVAVSRGGGGAADFWLFGLLLLTLVIGVGVRIWRHRQDALIRIDAPAPCWQARPGTTPRSPE